MNCIFKISCLSFFAIAGLAPVASATETKETPDDKLSVCQKSVSVLGASMGHKQVKAVDGRTLYRFSLRTSGLDYVADCDPQTGSIGDVVPRLATPEAAAS